jgi:hypothetical protein
MSRNASSFWACCSIIQEKMNVIPIGTMREKELMVEALQVSSPHFTFSFFVPDQWSKLAYSSCLSQQDTPRHHLALHPGFRPAC